MSQWYTAAAVTRPSLVPVIHFQNTTFSANCTLFSLALVSRLKIWGEGEGVGQEARRVGGAGGPSEGLRECFQAGRLSVLCENNRQSARCKCKQRCRRWVAWTAAGSPAPVH